MIQNLLAAHSDDEEKTNNLRRLHQILQGQQAELDQMNQIYHSLLAAHSDDEENTNNTNKNVHTDHEERDNATLANLLRLLAAHSDDEENTNNLNNNVTLPDLSLD